MANYSQDVVQKASDFDREAAPLKVRVHALAKQLGLSSKEMIVALGHAGIVVKAASSTVNHNQLEAVLNFITNGAPDAKDESGNDAAKTDRQSEAQVSDEEAEDKKPETKKAVKAKRATGKKASAKKTARVAKRSAKPEEDSVENPQASEKTEETVVDEKPKQRAAKKSTRKTTAKKDIEKKASIKKSIPQEAEPSVAVKQETKAEPHSKSENEQPGQRVSEEKPKLRSRRRTRRVARTAENLNEIQAETVNEAATEKAADAAKPETSAELDAELAAHAEAIVAAPLFLAPHAVAENATSPSESASGVNPDEAPAGDVETDSDDERQPRPRRRRRGRGRRRVEVRRDYGNSEELVGQDNASSAEPEPEDNPIEEPQAIRGSTRLEAQRRRRNERREQSRKRHVLSEAEFLARRESVERTMVVRERQRHDHAGIVTEVGVLEDDLLVEHFVTSDTQSTQIGNIYLGRVQNVLPSMEAAFVDIGTDRNAVIYVGDLNWKLMGVKGRNRKIEQVLKSGDQILVQVTKDPIGHKGARLTTHISLAGRFLVYVPGGRSAGISRKLPESERKRLKEILREVTPEGSGTIIRTAAEGVPKESIEADVQRLEKLWSAIWEKSEKAKARKGAKPLTMYEEPDMLVKVIRDVFNEDFTRLVVEGDRPWNTVSDYVGDVAPELEDRLQRYFPNEHGGADVFERFRVDEQLAKALERKVWLPSGGTLIIDRTEAMTVIDVNTGKFTGSGGNLEETVTRNNLEAAEEIVRQMRLRDLGGMIVVDFIDMVLPENQDLVLRRLKEALGRDRTRHEVSEVTSLGLVQMTRKRLGTGLLETFATPCCCCNGTGYKIHLDPVEHDDDTNDHRGERNNRNDGNGSERRDGGDKREQRRNVESSADKTNRQRDRVKTHAPQQHPAALAMHNDDAEQRNSAHAKEKQSKQQVNQSDRPANKTKTAKDSIKSGTDKSQHEPTRGHRSATTKRNARKDDFEPDLAELAAAAVAEAREKDPEEPSDDRYVSAHTGRRSRRRVTRVRKLENNSQRAARIESRHDDVNVEVVAKEKAAEEGIAKQPSKLQVRKDGSKPDERGRRGRRRVRRVRRIAVDDGAQVPVRESSAKGAQAPQRGQVKQTAEAAVKSYEEALADFEKSPRRRRPTRGNSRSDHAPKREEFSAADHTPEAEASERRRTARRRSTRRSSAAMAASKGENAPGKASRNTVQLEEKNEAKPVAKRRTGRRTVRRAVRRGNDR